MAPRKKFDKKNATTFNIVHRAHDDALFYDDEASPHVLVPAAQKGGKSRTIKDIEQKLTKDELNTIRDNEGLAAQYGILYDDSKYDYMQHLKPIGASEDAVFIGAKEDPQQKPKQNIEDLFKDQLPSQQKRKVQANLSENIPRELQGFNPNLDPRLREVLEALEDEAYIGDEEEDVDFDDLLKSGEVDDEEEGFYEDDYDEWDLDNYDDEYYEGEDYNENYSEEEAADMYNDGEAPADLEGEKITVSNQWHNDFMKYKNQTKNDKNDWDSDDEFEDEEEEGDALPELPEIQKKKVSGTKLRKKKGAMTDTSSFSMSSSALFRTEGLTLLDDRYEQLNKKFEKEDEQVEQVGEFDMKKERGDLEDMLDDFLDNYELESGGRKLAKKNEEIKKIKQAAESVSNSRKTPRSKGFNAAFARLNV